MDWIAVLNGALGAGGLAIILKLIDAYSNRNKTRADAAKIIVEGGAQAVQTMRDLLKDYDKINDDQAAEIEELKTGKKQRTKRIEDLESQVEDLIRKQEKDLEETQRLRNDYANAQKQIVKLEDLAIKLGENFDKLVGAIKDKGIDIPINGEILESVRRLKLSVEQRRRLAGGK
jgi:peptidoglycan hydrolase CwlO-like protein